MEDAYNKIWLLSDSCGHNTLKEAAMLFLISIT